MERDVKLLNVFWQDPLSNNSFRINVCTWSVRNNETIYPFKYIEQRSKWFLYWITKSINNYCILKIVIVYNSMFLLLNICNYCWGYILICGIIFSIFVAFILLFVHTMIYILTNNNKFNNFNECIKIHSILHYQIIKLYYMI